MTKLSGLGMKKFPPYHLMLFCDPPYSSFHFSSLLTQFEDLGELHHTKHQWVYMGLILHCVIKLRVKKISGPCQQWIQI